MSSLPEIDYESFEIKTKRLHIRPFKRSDFRVWVGSNDKTLPSQNQFDRGPSAATSRTKTVLGKVIRDAKQLWKKDRHYQLAIFDKKSGFLLGTMQIYIHARLVMQTAAIGYEIRNHSWGKGFGEEAVRALVQFAMKVLKLHRITAEIQPDNKKSIRLVKNIGFRKESLARGLVFIDEKWEDMLVYALTVEEFGLRGSKPVYRTRTKEI